jgi:hypothetical protein
MPDGPASPKDWRDEIESSFARGRSEQRRRNRANCNLAADLWLEDAAIQSTAVVRHAVVRNVSEMGAFIETEPMPVGTRLRLKLATDQGERSAEVVWMEDPGPSTRVRRVRGVGVRFLGVVDPRMG